MLKRERLPPDQHHKTKNKRGFMHPLSEISKQFVFFSASAKRPVIDMGCAYGNTVLAALDKGANTVIACDMEEEHLAALRAQIEDTQLVSHLVTKRGTFPDEFDFKPDSIDAIHASHLFEYLKGDEVDRGLANCFKWLHSGGKLFILTYSIYILELANNKFRAEYDRRLLAKVKWPGYLEDFDAYCELPETEKEATTQEESPFPTALHFFDIPQLVQALEAVGFMIECADYLDGRSNGAVEETWYDGREYVGIIAMKPKM